MFYHAIHHKLPAIYHAFAPQIPATPSKTPAKGAVSSGSPRQKKITVFAKKVQP
jgi:hypothetical protein